MDVVSARNGFILAAATCSAAAIWIPAALPLSGLILSMAGDPDAMRRAAADWRGPQSGEATGGDSIEQVKGELARLKQQIYDNEAWRGQAYASFAETVDTFNGLLDDFGRSRGAVADSLDSAADIYIAACRVCLAIAGVVAALAAIIRCFAASRLAWLAARWKIEAMVNSITRGLGTTLRTQSKVIFRAALILNAAGFLLGQTAQRLPAMRALRIEVPNFTKAQLTVNPGDGTLTRTPTLSGLPDLGGSGSIF
jgi:hypothetical protein